MSDAHLCFSGFAADRSVRSKYTQKTLDRELKELSIGIKFYQFRIILSPLLIFDSTDTPKLTLKYANF